MTTHILSDSLKRPGYHAVIFRKDVPIQGFTALWAGAHTWSVPGVRTCLLWVCYLHLTKLEFDTEEPIRRDPIVLWYFLGPNILNLFHMCLGLKDSDRIRYEITSYRVRFRGYFRWWQFIWWQYEIFIPITSHRMKLVHTRSICVQSE